MYETMNSLSDRRRYLTDFDSRRMGHVLTDTLVIGTGVAGCRAALAAAEYGLVTILTKQAFEDSCTQHAQGGIAAAVGPNDSTQDHFEDTVRVGCGLNRLAVVQELVSEAPRHIEELIKWGMEIDHVDGQVALGREGGHSTHRIVHAHGDQTGQELTRTLKRRIEGIDNIRVFEGCFLIDFVTNSGTCVGAITFHKHYGHQIIWAKQTILASGGCGRLWRETTNPPGVTGDGLGAAFRAGAVFADMEFVQFHPTTLYIAGSGRALISEAVRGEGALLVDRDGDRFMTNYHRDGELAPRDVVSRAIQTHLSETRANCVYLDVRGIASFAKRFPQIARLCADFQIDVTHDLIPVRPSAHYMIGGVKVDQDGSTSVPGLLACGEAANTGVHGANRIASNSLLEGLVFGTIAGQIGGQRAAALANPSAPLLLANRTTASDRTALDLADIQNSLRSLMWRNVGIVRQGGRLSETVDILKFWAHYTMDKTFDDVAGWQVQNQLTVALLVSLAALERTESIGVHYRKDSSSKSDCAPYRVELQRDEGGTVPIRRPMKHDGSGTQPASTAS